VQPGSRDGPVCRAGSGSALAAVHAEAPAFEIQQGPPSLEPLPVIRTAAEAYAIATQPISKSAGAKIDIATMLRSTSGLRDAIILREIFGPPRSLQPLDLVGSV